MTPAATPSVTDRRRARRLVALIALIAAAPVVLSTLVYLLTPDLGRTNYGELLKTEPFPAVRGVRADGAPAGIDAWRGRWLMIVAAPGACDAGCQEALYATRQARTLQAGERERVTRLWLVAGDSAPRDAVLRDHPDLVTLRVPADAVASLPRGGDPIYLVDPLGNQVLAWPRKPDVKSLAKDLARVLRASRIG